MEDFERLPSQEREKGEKELSSEKKEVPKKKKYLDVKDFVGFIMRPPDPDEEKTT